MTSEKQNSEITITCTNITYKTEGGLNPQANIIAGDGEITYKLYTDEACQSEYLGYKYNSTLLPIGTYYIKEYMAQTDNYKASESNIVKVEVTRNYIDNKALLAGIEEAEKFYEENESMKSDYNGAAWNTVYDTGGTLAKANKIKNDTEGLFPQSEVDEAAENLTTSLETLRNSPADTTEIKAELQRVIENSETISNIYSEKSWSEFQTALTDAKETLAKENEFKSVYTAAKDTLLSAIENLTTEEAGDPFILIQKNAKERKRRNSS